AAIPHELIEGFVALSADIHLHSREQVEQGRTRQIEATLGVGQRECGYLSVGAIEACLCCVEERELSHWRIAAVTDVIHPPGECIDGAHRPSLRSWQQADPVIEV